MPTTLKIHRVNALPGTPEASSLYIVKTAEPDIMDLYVTSTDGLEVRHIISKSEIESLVSPIVLSMGVIRAVLNLDGTYSLKLANDSILQHTPQVYAWPGITIPGIETLPAANTFQHAAVVRLHKDNFVGFGANPVGVEIQADAINNIWRPYKRQVIWSGFFGLIGSNTVFLTAPGRFDIGTDPILPAGLLNYTNARMRFSEWLYSENALATTGPNMSIYIGTADTANYTTNASILSNNLNIADTVTSQPETLFRRETVTSGITTRNTIRGGNGASGGLLNVLGGLLNFGSNQTITLASTSLGSATRLNLLGFEIAWEG